jgi:hypothetical protein
MPGKQPEQASGGQQAEQVLVRKGQGKLQVDSETSKVGKQLLSAFSAQTQRASSSRSSINAES